MTFDPWRQAEARQAFIASLPVATPAAARAFVFECGASTSGNDAVENWAGQHGVGTEWCVRRLHMVAESLRSRGVSSPDHEAAWQPFNWYTFAEDDAGDPRTGTVLDTVSAVLGDTLAPLEADPTRESRQAFLEYAAYHYDARARALVAAGVPLSRSKPETGAHAVWTLRYQVGRESYGQISRSERRAKQSIAEAVQRFAILIDLPLRTTAVRK